MESTIMIVVCCYCNKIIKTKMADVERYTIDKDRGGFTISHGACPKCQIKVMAELAEMKKTGVLNDYKEV